jgi:arsenite/tail-anchored protein-transporting ATPase
MNDAAPRRDSSFIAQLSSILSSRRVLLIGGKGGVGKTTLSCAVALHLARTQRTILFTTDPASNLSDIFDSPVANLTIEALGAEQLYARFLERNLASFLELGDRGTYLDKDELRRFFELSLPGVDELMAWMHIGELAEANTGATIVIDTAPTGHTLRMLGAAEHFRQFASALNAMQEKHRGMVRQFTRRDGRDAMDAFIETFTGESARRRALLTSSSTAFIPVLLAQPWVIEQTKRLIAEVRADGLDVPVAVLNRSDARTPGIDIGVPMVNVPRACTPLDTPGRIAAWCEGTENEQTGSGARSAGWSQQPVTLKAARLTFVAGKGGVGKTTTSASLALQLARKHPEKTYTVISVDPAHSLRDVFAVEEPPANLTVEAVDTKAKWRAFRDSLGEEIDRAVNAIAPSGMTVAYDAEAMRKLVEIAPPGADELFAVNRLAELVADQRQAAIIVDTAPTGHFLRLTDLPKSAGEWVHEFMRILLRYKDLVSPGSLGEELIRASRALHALDEAMHSPNCQVIVVTRPERIVIAETLRLIAELKRRGMAVGGIVANYLTPENDDPCDRSLRSFESAALSALGLEVVAVERQDAPVTRLGDLAALVPLRE